MVAHPSIPTQYYTSPESRIHRVQACSGRQLTVGLHLSSVVVVVVALLQFEHLNTHQTQSRRFPATLRLNQTKSFALEAMQAAINGMTSLTRRASAEDKSSRVPHRKTTDGLFHPPPCKDEKGGPGRVDSRQEGFFLILNTCRRIFKQPGTKPLSY